MLIRLKRISFIRVRLLLRGGRPSGYNACCGRSAEHVFREPGVGQVAGEQTPAARAEPARLRRRDDGRPETGERTRSERKRRQQPRCEVIRRGRASAPTRLSYPRSAATVPVRSGRPSIEPRSFVARATVAWLPGGFVWAARRGERAH